MTTPTPTPWRPDASGHLRGTNGRQIVLSLSGLALSCGVPDPQDKIDGAFVLKACNSHAQLVAALRAMDALVTKAQGILEAHLYPDSAQDSDETVNRLLELLDGPEQRAAQHPARAALATAEGEP